MQFTERYIQSLKSKNKRYDVREGKGSGFALRISPAKKKSNGEIDGACKKTWCFFYFFDGRKKRLTLGNYPQLTLANARKKHREALQLLENGKDPSFEKHRKKIEERESYTVASLVKEYIEIWAKPNKRSWEADDRCLRKDVISGWGKRKAKDITRRDVILLLDRIKDRGAPIQANRTLACVRRLFNFAIERDLISASPCVSVKPVVKENRRDRVLSAQEIKSFWNALDTHERLHDGSLAVQISLIGKYVLKFQLITAQRKGEVVRAEWSEICLDTGWWTIPQEKAKNKLGHRVPLSKLAIDLLNHIKSMRLSDRWVFPSEKKHIKEINTDGTVKKVSRDKFISGAAIDHAMRRSTFKDIKPFSPHDLRRTPLCQRQ